MDRRRLSADRALLHLHQNALDDERMLLRDEKAENERLVALLGASELAEAQQYDKLLPRRETEAEDAYLKRLRTVLARFGEGEGGKALLDWLAFAEREVMGRLLSEIDPAKVLSLQAELRHRRSFREDMLFAFRQESIHAARSKRETDRQYAQLDREVPLAGGRPSR